MINFSLLILCAGYGKRMKNLTRDIPKPLLKINDKTLLQNTVNFFYDIGCKEFFINTHYLHNKIESYVHENLKNYQINQIYEPTILGTGGAVKNIFNYTNNKNICVVNCDIFWNTENKIDVFNFLKDINDIKYCKLLLSEKNNFYGLKKNKGDFTIKEGFVSNWSSDKNILYYAGLQIVSKNIFQKKVKIFSMNEVWQSLIVDNKLKGAIIPSKILHIGDKNSFDKL